MQRSPSQPQPPPTDVAVRPAAVPVAAEAEPSELSRPRAALAFVVAALSDAISVWLEAFPPGQVLLDVMTAGALWALLGWRWYLLPAFLMEAVPGSALFPTWVLVVGAYVALPAAKLPVPKPPAR